MRGSMIASLASFCLTFMAVADDQQANYWQWTCSSMVFYGMHVAPDGTYKPFGEPHPVKVTIKLSNDRKDEECPANKYHFEIDGKAGNFSRAAA